MFGGIRLGMYTVQPTSDTATPMFNLVMPYIRYCVMLCVINMFNSVAGKLHILYALEYITDKCCYLRKEH